MTFLVTTCGLVYLYARATRDQARYGTVTGKGFREFTDALSLAGVDDMTLGPLL